VESLSPQEQTIAKLEARVAAAPWFDGEDFSLVDAVFGPVFRYFDVFDEIADLTIRHDIGDVFAPFITH